MKTERIPELEDLMVEMTEEAISVIVESVNKNTSKTRTKSTD